MAMNWANPFAPQQRKRRPRPGEPGYNPAAGTPDYGPPAAGAPGWGGPPVPGPAPGGGGGQGPAYQPPMSPPDPSGSGSYLSLLSGLSGGGTGTGTSPPPWQTPQARNPVQAASTGGASAYAPQATPPTGGAYAPPPQRPPAAPAAAEATTTPPTGATTTPPAAGTTPGGFVPGTGVEGGSIIPPNSPLYEPQKVIQQLFSDMGLNPYASRTSRMLMDRASELMYSVLGRMLGGQLGGPAAIADDNAFRQQLRSAAQRAMQGGSEFGLAGGGTADFDRAMQQAMDLSVGNTTAAGGTGPGAILAEFLGQNENAQNLVESMRYGNFSPQSRKVFSQSLGQAGSAFDEYTRQHPLGSGQEYLNLLNYLIGGPGKQYMY